MTEQRQWILRFVCLILLLALCVAYQQQANAWQQQSAENRAAVAEAEAHNAEIRALQAQAENAETVESQKYADGSYTASGMGFGGKIEVTVAVLEDKITEISIGAHDGEDAVYFAEAKAVVDRILAAQSTDVDTVTGATFSSTGILEAVKAALQQAEDAA